MNRTDPHILYQHAQTIHITRNDEMIVRTENAHMFGYVLKNEAIVNWYNSNQHSQQNENNASSNELVEGELFYVRRHMCIRLYQQTFERTTIVLIRFQTSGSELFDRADAFTHMPMPHVQHWLSEFHDTRDSRTEKVQEAVVERSFARHCERQAHLYHLVAAYFYERYAGKERHEMSNINMEQYVQQTIHYMHEHYNEPIDIEQLARQSRASTSRFYQTFKEQTGVTPKKLLTSIRLEASLRILAQSEKTIAETAHAVGYNDQYYFSRLFKKQIGMTPSIYRERTRLRIDS